MSRFAIAFALAASLTSLVLAEPPRPSIPASVVDATVAKLVAAHGAFKPVVRVTRGQVGQNREYKYADLATLIEATFPALLANGINHPFGAAHRFFAEAIVNALTG